MKYNTDIALNHACWMCDNYEIYDNGCFAKCTLHGIDSGDEVNACGYDDLCPKFEISFEIKSSIKK